jgi:hypothetical protein
VRRHFGHGHLIEATGQLLWTAQPYKMLYKEAPYVDHYRVSLIGEVRSEDDFRERFRVLVKACCRERPSRMAAKFWSQRRVPSDRG